jgi:hypothetical protein
MKKLLVAALMVVLASPAFAAIQNVKVSGDITSTFLDRDNFDLGMTVGNSPISEYVGNDPRDLYTNPSFDPLGLKKQNVFITQTRLRVDADLSDNVSTTVGLINERAWNSEQTGYNTSDLDTNVQLYLASITLREFLYSPLTVTIGRQIFNYGNGLIMGDGGVNNQGTGNLQFIAQDLTERTSYDGVKAILDYKPLTIDLIYFKNGQGEVNGNPNSDLTDSDVYGYNVNYQLSDPFNTVVETYMFSRITGNQDAFQGVGTNFNSVPADKGDTLFVPGLRASTNPTKSLNIQGEVAWQLGNHPVTTVTTTAGGTVSVQHEQTEHRDAMAAQLLATYTLPMMDKYKPTLNASYTYVSGDKNSNQNYSSDPITSSKTYTAWDPFNENQGGGTIYNTLFPLSGMSILALGASANPLEDVTTSFTWSDLWAAEKYGAQNPLGIFQPDSGAELFYPSTTNKGGLGNESDVNISYAYTEDVTFGVSLGWFIPGDVFTKGQTRDTASQAIANVAVKF